MNSKIKTILVVSLGLNLSACGWLTGDDGYFRDRSNDYRKSQELEYLKIPTGINVSIIDDSYAIPEISDRADLTSEFVVPRPEALGEDVNREAVRISRLGDEQWVLVNIPPGQVWPRLRSFFNLGRVGLLRADAIRGVLETAWIQPVDSSLPKERYQLRIEQGVQRGSSEVRVTHMDIAAGLDWPESSSSTERENKLVQQLAQFLADSSINSSVSMLAEQAINASGRVTIEQQANREPHIVLQLPYYRAWASLGLAIGKAGYITDDLDATQQVYYVHYVHDEEEDEAWFSGWFSDNTDTIQEGDAYFVRMIKRDEQQVEITIELQSGEVMAEGEADMLLKLIKRHLA
ncbi:MAG: outer membrane protein assembly factor BamC [Pseudohongiellaceae bacterium]|jgi:outer membrane protein assembly factor BamC